MNGKYHRLFVFVFYDAEGIVDEYIEYMLSRTKEISQDIYIIINGKIVKQSFLKLKQYSNHIFQRDNKGFDAGAYKDFFDVYINVDELSKWDEIILFNDTFYGPFGGWNKIFERYEQEDVDFWGLSFHPSGYLEQDEIKIEFSYHIQGYFISIRKKMFLDNRFFDFWKKLDYPKSYYEAVISFEVDFTEYFKKLGYRCSTYLELTCSDFICNYNDNPYIKYYDKLIKDYNFPLFKKKAFSLLDIKKIANTFDYVHTEYNYDLNLVIKNMEHMIQEGRIKPYNPAKLKKFYHTHKKIYLYGSGKYGKGIANFFEFMRWKYVGFITTEQSSDLSCISYDKLKLEKEDGIIITMGEKNFNQIKTRILNDYSASQIFIPEYN